MEYKGYLAHTEFDDEANKRLFGFLCRAGEEPEQPFSGRFTVRLSPEQHRQVILAAEKAGKGIEMWAA